MPCHLYKHAYTSRGNQHRVFIFTMFKRISQRISSLDVLLSMKVKYEWIMLCNVIKFNWYLDRIGYEDVRILNQTKFLWARHTLFTYGANYLYEQGKFSDDGDQCLPIEFKCRLNTNTTNMLWFMQDLMFMNMQVR